jgi:membrane protease YdiL (CAAX protease family)
MGGTLPTDGSGWILHRLRAAGVATAVGIVGLLVGLVLSAVAALALLLGGVDVQSRPFLVIVVSLILVQGVAFGGVALGYLRYRDLGWGYVPARLPSIRDLLAVLAGYVLAFLGVSAGTLLITSTGAEPAENQIGEIATQSPDVLLVLVPASFLLIGPGEELLFRGVVQGRIREVFGPVAGVVLASVIFAAIHVTALTGGLGGRLATIAILFFPSLVFGSAYELTDNIVVPALIHAAYNATLFAGLYVYLQSGGAPPTLL